MQTAWIRRRTGAESQVGPTRARNLRIRPGWRRPSAFFAGRNGRKWSRRSRTASLHAAREGLGSGVDDGLGGDGGRAGGVDPPNALFLEDLPRGVADRG